MMHAKANSINSLYFSWIAKEKVKIGWDEWQKKYIEKKGKTTTESKYDTAESLRSGFFSTLTLTTTDKCITIFFSSISIKDSEEEEEEEETRPTGRQEEQHSSKEVVEEQKLMEKRYPKGTKIRMTFQGEVVGYDGSSYIITYGDQFQEALEEEEMKEYVISNDNEHSSSDTNHQLIVQPTGSLAEQSPAQQNSNKNHDLITRHDTSLFEQNEETEIRFQRMDVELASQKVEIDRLKKEFADFRVTARLPANHSTPGQLQQQEQEHLQSTNHESSVASSPKRARASNSVPQKEKEQQSQRNDRVEESIENWNDGSRSVSNGLDVEQVEQVHRHQQSQRSESRHASTDHIDGDTRSSSQRVKLEKIQQVQQVQQVQQQELKTDIRQHENPKTPSPLRGRVGVLRRLDNDDFDSGQRPRKRRAVDIKIESET